MEGVECNSKLEDNHGELWRESQFEIQCLKVGQTKTFNGTLKLLPKVTPQPHHYPSGDSTRGAKTQQLEWSNLVSPKSYPCSASPTRGIIGANLCAIPRKSAVFVSCASTTKEQFNAWSDLLTKRLGLGVKYYSVSMYGTFDPDFRPPNGGIELAQSFMGKLVIVLDDIFNPLDESFSRMELSRMIRNGSQSQTWVHEQEHQLAGGGFLRRCHQTSIFCALHHTAKWCNQLRFLVGLQKSLKEQRTCIGHTNFRICDLSEAALDW